MNDRITLLHRAVTAHYVHHETMESIARTLGVSRSTVSRLLSQAREEGLVKITVAPEVGARSPLAQRLATAFEVRVHLVEARATTALAVRMSQVAQRAASVLADIVADDQRIGVAWGATVASLARHLPPTPLINGQIVQINGSINPRTSGVPFSGGLLQAFGEAFDSPVVLFPVPAFFDYESTKEAMWRERSVRHVLDLRARLDVAVFGIGSMSGSVPSHVYAAGYLDETERERLRSLGVVGDVCTILLREDGTWADIPENARATGLTPSELQGVPRRVCVASDPLRAPALIGALRSGAITDLVLDEQTARAVIGRH